MPGGTRSGLGGIENSVVPRSKAAARESSIELPIQIKTQ